MRILSIPQVVRMSHPLEKRYLYTPKVRVPRIYLNYRISKTLTKIKLLQWAHDCPCTIRFGNDLTNKELVHHKIKLEYIWCRNWLRPFSGLHLYLAGSASSSSGKRMSRRRCLDACNKRYLSPREKLDAQPHEDSHLEVLPFVPRHLFRWCSAHDAWLQGYRLNRIKSQSSALDVAMSAGDALKPPSAVQEIKQRMDERHSLESSFERLPDEIIEQ